MSNPCAMHASQSSFECLEAAVAVLPELLYSEDARVVYFAALATYHLAIVPDIKEPLGNVGSIAALVAYMRRCGDRWVMCGWWGGGQLWCSVRQSWCTTCTICLVVWEVTRGAGAGTDGDA